MTKRKSKSSGGIRVGMPTASSFGNLEGQATLPLSTRIYFLKVILDFETDIANIKSEWIVPALNKLMNDKIIHRWNATQLDNYADLTCYGAQLLAELKAQTVMKEYVPGITRSDSTQYSPFTRATWEGLLLSLGNLRIPPMSYALVNLVDKVIQGFGAEPDEGTLASYVYPFIPNKTYAQIETLLATIEGLYDAAVYATQSGQMLVPVDLNWLNTVNEVSMVSHFAQVVSEYYPILRDNGGAETETEEAFTSTTDLRWSQILGIPEYADALAFFRGTSGAPHVLTVQSVANDKQSILQGSGPDSTTLTEYDKDTTGLDWMYSVATAGSRTRIGMFTATPGSISMVRKDNVLPSAAAWDRRMANWLARHSKNPGVPEASLPVLPDIIGTVKRGNPIIREGSPRNPRGARGASEQAAAKDAGYSNMIDAQVAGNYQKGGKRYEVDGW